MELEQRNEVVWSVKRKNQAEKFLLRLVDENGNKQIGLGLEKDGKQILFEMENEEFQNFYGILSAFRELAEKKPEQQIHSISLQTQISSENNSATKKASTPSVSIKVAEANPIVESPKIIIPVKTAPETSADDMDNLAAMAGALNELSDNFNSSEPEPAPIPRKQVESKPISQAGLEVPKIGTAGKMAAPQVAPNTPIVDNGPLNGIDTKKSTASKPKLNPNEWDPW